MNLTIAIPTYRRAGKLLGLVGSIVPQLTERDEILVVNDDPADEGLRPLGALPRVRLENNPSNLGMVANWNRCLQLAKGAWICTIHDDDVVAPTALRTLRTVTEHFQQPAIIGNGAIDATGEAFEVILRTPGREAVVNSAFCPSGTTVHRDVLGACGLFATEFPYSPDVEYFARIAARFASIAIVSPCIVRYEEHSANAQYSTWRRPDFLDQLLEIETRVAAYAGLNGDAARDFVGKRMLSHMMYMRYRTRVTGDLVVHRKVLLQLLRGSSLGVLGKAKLLKDLVRSGLVFGRNRPGTEKDPMEAA